MAPSLLPQAHKAGLSLELSGCFSWFLALNENVSVGAREASVMGVGNGARDSENSPCPPRGPPGWLPSCEMSSCRETGTTGVGWGRERDSYQVL